MNFRRLKLQTYTTTNGFERDTYVAFSHEQAAQMFAAEHPQSTRILADAFGAAFVQVSLGEDFRSITL